jgi:DNA replication protein DnaC
LDFYDKPRKLTGNDYRLMLLPEEYKGSELTDLVNDAFRQSISNYVKAMRTMYEDHVGLLIWGPPSSGKSEAAAILAKEARRRFKSAMFVPIWDLRESVLNRVMFVSGKSPMQRAKEVDFLVLDGLDTEDGDAKFFNLAEIARLIGVRKQQGKLTVVTSRLSPRDMKQDPKFSKFLKGIETKLTPIDAPDPKAAITARKAHMKNLLKGGE